VKLKLKDKNKLKKKTKREKRKNIISMNSIFEEGFNKILLFFSFETEIVS